MYEKAIILFSKKPKLGHVKTRIAKSLGDSKALAIHKELLEITLKMLQRVECKKYLFWDELSEESPEFLYHGFDIRSQKGKDLGERMENAFSDVIPFHDKVLILGTDCPCINAEILEEAFVSLDTSDLVLGPAADGGYYLLGKKVMNPMVFKDIQWSTDTVLADTIKTCKEQKLKFNLLRVLSDIDTEEDYIQWKTKAN
ncbi:MAG: TIGR04282 family arsenosugar biosynthesis glycosyltransferase [Leptospira sp.]|nr:TIGR04282 family arsenosugar biosynthesis glycosyltransferase [Leptospira sp.]